MTSPFIQIKTKFIILFSVLMAVVLLLQFYFMDRAQKEIIEELGRMSTRINAATDIIYVGDENKFRIKAAQKMAAKEKRTKVVPPRAVAILEEDENDYVIRVETKVDSNLVKSRSILTSVTRKPKADLRKIFEKMEQQSLFVKAERRIDSIWKEQNAGKFRWTYSTDSINPDMNMDQDFSYYLNSNDDSLTIIIDEIHTNTPGPKERVFSFVVPHLISPGNPHFVRYNYNTEELYDTLQNSRNRNIFITFLLFALSLVGITLIARNFEKPIHDLRDSFTKVVGGDLDTRVVVTSNDEVGELAGSFNLMVDELRKNREKEQLLNRKERMAALGQLAAGVAHEIKNPLNSINLTISHLSDKFVDAKDEGALKYISTIHEEIGRLDKTVNDFLNYVRSDSLDIRETDIQNLINNILNLYEREISHNKIELYKKFAKSFVLNLDGERIKTALINIILNAIQAMPDGGKLEIITKPRNREIIIRDNGKGIQDKDLTNIFDLFYTTKSTGTGLGLPTAYKIIKAHGGEILIESEEDTGTTVTVRFRQEK